MKTQAEPRPRARMTRDERRRQLIEVALEMFSRHGFGGTTTRSIAAAAGVSEAILFRHFATKEELYTAILEHKAALGGKDEWLAELCKAAERDDDQALFGIFLTKILESYQRDPQFQRVMLYASLEGHEIANIWNRTLGIPVYEFLRGYIARRQQSGALRKSDPGAVVFALAGMGVYYAITSRLFDLHLLDLSDEEVASTFAALVLDGLKEEHENEAQK